MEPPYHSAGKRAWADDSSSPSRPPIGPLEPFGKEMVPECGTTLVQMVQVDATFDVGIRDKCWSLKEANQWERMIGILRKMGPAVGGSPE